MRNWGAPRVHRKAGSLVKGISQPRRWQAKAAVAVMLTFSAGMVDIVGYISVYHFFVAHMTGNTVHLGYDLVRSSWEAAAKTATIIASFVLASVVGRAIIEAGARKRLRTIASLSLLLEALLIVAFIWLQPGVSSFHQRSAAPLLPLLALLAAAMGLQTATLTKIGPLTIHTTFVTGMLNKFAEAASEWLFWLHDQIAARRGWRGSTQNRALRNAGFMALIWVTYMSGALAGTWLYSRRTVSILYLPVALLVVSAGIDQRWPLSIEEQKEQEQA